MATDPLNPFQPYENLPANHENQLTRALLILLRLCPMAHATWLRLVAGDRELPSLAPATFDTQKHHVPVARDAEEPPELISVFLTPEKPLSQGVIKESDRGQVLDAIIDYGGSPVVVVENKVVEDSIAQAENINTGGRIDIGDGQTAVVIQWRDLIERLSGLIEKDLVGGGEKTLLEDFLTYVEEHFESLGPYRTLSLCGQSRLRIERRLRSLLADATGNEAKIDQHGPTVDFGGTVTTAARAYLNLDRGDLLALAVYPADTLSQARSLYSQPDLVEATRRLGEKDGWELRPNFHLGFMSSGYCWTNSTMPINEYLDFWSDEIDSVGAVPRAEWEAFWTMLLEKGVAASEDQPEFDKHFVSTERATATPRPGLELRRIWDLEEARELDSPGALLNLVIESLREMRRVLGISPGA